MKLCLIFLCLIIISCQNQPNKDVKTKFEDYKKSKYFDEERIFEDKMNVKENGDELSFKELIIYYKYNSSRKEDIIPYSILIVDKYKKYEFCTTVFDNFLELYTGKESLYEGTKVSLINDLERINLLNEIQQKHLLCYLNLGAVNNDLGSINYLEILNREGYAMDINVKKADSLFLILSKNKIR